ncbi:MAG: HK97-gp10 family putative phage morphogenesis protein [Bacteroidota bacterium]
MSKPLVEVRGFEELSKKLKQFPDKVKKQEVAKLLRKAAGSTVKAARQQAPISERAHTLKKGKKVQPGNLKKSIGVQTARRSKNPMVVVRPRTKGKYNGFYGRFVIRGHNIYRKGVKRNRKGNQRANAKGAVSKVSANPFMNRARDKTRGRVTQEAVRGVENYIQKQVNRL